MNSLTYSNYLLFDVFALTAFLREGRDYHSETLVPEILAAWNETAPLFMWDGFSHFRNFSGTFSRQTLPFTIPHVGTDPDVVPQNAIQNKVPLEQEMVSTFSAWAAAFSNRVLPTLETILDDELIPEYQRTLTASIPGLAQMATNRIAQRHGWKRGAEVHAERGPLQGLLWAGFLEEPNPIPVILNDPRTLPVVDPVLDEGEGYYREVARHQRKTIAERYRREWNSEKVGIFNTVARMSQFYRLWDGFTKAQLRRLIDENYVRNLPFVIYTDQEVIQREMKSFTDGQDSSWPLGASQTGTLIGRIRRTETDRPVSPEMRNDFLNDRYMFVGTMYWKPISALLPGLFANPLEADNVTYAQVMLFVPRSRLQWNYITYGYVNGDGQNGLIDQDEAAVQPSRDQIRYTSGDSMRWDLLNQNWRVQLVPATHPRLPEMLTQQPPLEGQDQQPTQEVRPLELSGMEPDDLYWISHH